MTTGTEKGIKTTEAAEDIGGNEKCPQDALFKMKNEKCKM